MAKRGGLGDEIFCAFVRPCATWAGQHTFTECCFWHQLFFAYLVLVLEQQKAALRRAHYAESRSIPQHGRALSSCCRATASPNDGALWLCTTHHQRLQRTPAPKSTRPETSPKTKTDPNHKH